MCIARCFFLLHRVGIAFTSETLRSAYLDLPSHNWNPTSSDRLNDLQGYMQTLRLDQFRSKLLAVAIDGGLVDSACDFDASKPIPRSLKIWYAFSAMVFFEF